MANDDPAPKTEKPKSGNEIGMPPLVALRGAESLRLLRDRVQKTAQELNRLHKENQKLAQRVAELERGPAIDPNTTILSFEENPDRLRERINGFIQAIDTYLARKPHNSAKVD